MYSIYDFIFIIKSWSSNCKEIPVALKDGWMRVSIGIVVLVLQPSNSRVWIGIVVLVLQPPNSRVWIGIVVLVLQPPNRQTDIHKHTQAAPTLLPPVHVLLINTFTLYTLHINTYYP